MNGGRTEGVWLTYTEAAERLGVTTEAIRHRVRRSALTGTHGNDGKPRVWLPVQTVQMNGRERTVQTVQMNGSGVHLNESPSERTPIKTDTDRLIEHLERQLADRDAQHKAEIERLERQLAERDRLHREHVERLERAWKANAAALVENVGRVLVAQRRRSWWSRWLGASKRSDLG